MIPIALKQGTTLALSLVFRDAAGALVALDGYAISAQLRDAQGVLVADLVKALPANMPGTLNLTSSGSTAAWPTGRLFVDVVLSRGGVVSATQTVAVLVSPAISIPGSS